MQLIENLNSVSSNTKKKVKIQNNTEYNKPENS